MANISAKSVKSGLEHLTVTQADKEVKEKFVDDSKEAKIKQQKKEFFALLSAQLQNQDPTQPLDTNQMSQQIFAINQVEQQLETNKHLSNIEDFFTSQQVSNAVSYIDKLAHYEGNRILLQGDEKPELSYELPEGVVRAQIVIRNNFGNEVHRETVSNKSGPNTFKWTTTNDLDKGIYSYDIEALDEEDASLPVIKYGYGKVKSVITENGSSALEVNNEVVPLEKIQKYSNLPSITTMQ